MKWFRMSALSLLLVPVACGDSMAPEPPVEDDKFSATAVLVDLPLAHITGAECRTERSRVICNWPFEANDDLYAKTEVTRGSRVIHTVHSYIEGTADPAVGTPFDITNTKLCWKNPVPSWATPYVPAAWTMSNYCEIKLIGDRLVDRAEGDWPECAEVTASVSLRLYDNRRSTKVGVFSDERGKICGYTAPETLLTLDRLNAWAGSRTTTVRDDTTFFNDGTHILRFTYSGGKRNCPPRYNQDGNKQCTHSGW